MTLSKTADTFISVVIPMCNEENYIGKCVGSLINQDYRKDCYEILVVDGASSDNSRSIVQSLASNQPYVFIVDNLNILTPFAFNFGIRKSKGEIIVILGAHSFVGPDFLKKIAEAFDRVGHDADCIGGRIVREAGTKVGSAIELARRSLLGGGLSIRNDPTVEECMVQESNIAYIWRRKVFEKVGLFDERFVKNQDNEFNLRTLSAGFKTLYSPGIVFHYYAPSNFPKLFRQIFGYTSYMPMIILKHRKFLYSRMAISLIAFLLWSLFLILGTIKVISIFVPLVLLGVYTFIIMSAAFIVSQRASKLNYWSAVCFAYFTIHIAGALGYLQGIFRLFNFNFYAGN
jgi:GT2 family glycosyltransferase